MTRLVPGLVAACLLATTVQAGSPTRPAAQGKDRTNANVMTALRGNLLAVHATFDGFPVLGLERTGTCSARLSTTKGATAVNWTELGALAPRGGAGKLTFKIPSGGITHLLVVSENDLGNRVNMGLGLLDEIALPAWAPDVDADYRTGIALLEAACQRGG